MTLRAPRSIALPLCIALVGCTTLTRAGRRVRVVDDPVDVQGCEYLGEVEGSGVNTAPGERFGGNAFIARKSAKNDARNKAGALGADTLLGSDTDMGVFEATTKPGAYRCDPADSVATDE